MFILDQSQNQINDYFDALTDLFYNRISCDETKEIALAMAMKDDEKVLELFGDFNHINGF